MTAFSRDPVDFDGERWYADTEALAEHLREVCRGRGLALRIRRTTSPSSLRGFHARWAIDDGALWLVELEGEQYRLDEVTGPAPGPFGLPPGAKPQPLSLRLLDPGAAGRVLAAWFSGPFPLVDQVGGWSPIGRRVELRIDRGRVA